jgi:hypothetical protein
VAKKSQQRRSALLQTAPLSGSPDAETYITHGSWRAGLLVLCYMYAQFWTAWTAAEVAQELLKLHVLCCSYITYRSWQTELLVFCCMQALNPDGIYGCR